jgi:hypothetical protein
MSEDELVARLLAALTADRELLESALETVALIRRACGHLESALAARLDGEPHHRPQLQLVPPHSPQEPD